MPSFFFSTHQNQVTRSQFTLSSVWYPWTYFSGMNFLICSIMRKEKFQLLVSYNGSLYCKSRTYSGQTGWNWFQNGLMDSFWKWVLKNNAWKSVVPVDNYGMTQGQFDVSSKPMESSWGKTWPKDAVSSSAPSSASFSPSLSSLLFKQGDHLAEDSNSFLSGILITQALC